MGFDLDRPFSRSLGVLAARDAYLAENGFTVDTYDAKGSNVTVLGFDVYRPLTEKARWAIRRHDLHHVATGYGTDMIGEAEVSAWELRRGLGQVGLYVRLIITSAALLGFWLSPRRVLAAWRAGAGPGTCLFDAPDYDALLKLSVEQLRASVGAPPDGIARAPRKLHAHAPVTNALAHAKR